MIFPIDKVTITCTAADEDLDKLVQYWYHFAGKELKDEDDFADSFIEREGENITIKVHSIFNLSLNAFDGLANKFPNLTFKLIADRDFFDHHILVYQNGVKTIHINKYYHFERLSPKTKKETIYISDHLNRLTRVKKEIIKDEQDYKKKKIYIVYDNLIVNYIQREEMYLDDDRNNYEYWF